MAAHIRTGIRHHPVRRKRLILGIVFVVVLSIIAAWLAVSIVLVPPAVLEVLRTKNLGAINGAFALYHLDHGSYPPLYTTDDNGRRLHSWRVLILPYLGETQLYSEIKLDEPWDSPHNRSLQTRMPKLYRVPILDDVGKTEETDQSGNTLTGYFAVITPNGIWRGSEGVKPSEVKNPAMICVVEEIDSHTVWMEPRDLTLEQALTEVQSKMGDRIPQRVPSVRIETEKPGRICYLTLGVGVQMVDRKTDRETLRKWWLDDPF